MSASDIDALTPEIASEIDATLRAHAQSHPHAQHSLTAGGLGAAIAGPLIKIVLAKLVPALEAQALKMIDAEMAKIQAAHPGLDLSFVHGLAETLFAVLTAAATGQAGAVTPGADVGPGIV
jgi:hypothetical protein